MSQGSVPLTSRPEWQALKTHQAELESTHMRELFSSDPDRASRFFIRGGGLSLDYSRNRITDDTLAKLMALARECGVPERIEAMFRGDHINVTEKRPALHIALRDTSGAPIHVDGMDIAPEVERTLNRMEQFVDDVLSKRWQGHTGKAFTDVVSIGIGGSFLGPKLVSEALRPYWHGQLKGHYVANIDGTQMAEILRRVNPETTLFLIQSKSFRTQETLENSKVAGTGSWTTAAAKTRSRSTSWRLPPTPRKPLTSASPKTTSSQCGTGWADATHCGLPSACP